MHETATARPTRWGDTPTSPKRTGMRIQRGPHNVFIPDEELAHVAHLLTEHLAELGHPILSAEDQQQRDAILALGKMAEQTITMTYPGKILEDSEGRPLAVTQPRTEEGTSMGVAITRSEATRYRIPDDAPGVQIIDLEGGQQ